MHPFTSSNVPSSPSHTLPITIPLLPSTPSSATPVATPTRPHPSGAPPTNTGVGDCEEDPVISGRNEVQQQTLSTVEQVVHLSRSH